MFTNPLLDIYSSYLHITESINFKQYWTADWKCVPRIVQEFYVNAEHNDESDIKTKVLIANTVLSNET